MIIHDVVGSERECERQSQGMNEGLHTSKRVNT